MPDDLTTATANREPPEPIDIRFFGRKVPPARMNAELTDCVRELTRSGEDISRSQC